MQYKQSNGYYNQPFHPELALTSVTLFVPIVTILLYMIDFVEVEM